MGRFTDGVGSLAHRDSHRRIAGGRSLLQLSAGTAAFLRQVHADNYRALVPSTLTVMTSMLWNF